MYPIPVGKITVDSWSFFKAGTFELLISTFAHIFPCALCLSLEGQYVSTLGIYDGLKAKVGYGIQPDIRLSKRLR